MLPEDATLTGAWTVPNSGALGVPVLPENGTSYVSISFPVKLESPPAYVLVKSEQDKSGEGCDATIDSGGELEGGTPEAASGTLCVYLTTGMFFAGGITVSSFNPASFETAGTGTAGALLKVQCGAGNPLGCPGVKGVWAVTG